STSITVFSNIAFRSKPTPLDVAASHGSTSRSFPRTREAGFTLEVQHFGEGFSRGPEVKTLSRRIVVGPDQGIESFGRQLGEVDLARQEAAHAPDGILDAAFLPRGIGIAEECLDRQAMQLVMMSELGSVVEGDGLPQPSRQTCEQLGDPPSDRPGRLV